MRVNNMSECIRKFLYSHYAGGWPDPNTRIYKVHFHFHNPDFWVSINPKSVIGRVLSFTHIL